MQEAARYEASLVEWKDKLKEEAVRQLQDRSAVLQTWAGRLTQQEKALREQQVASTSGSFVWPLMTSAIRI